MKYIFLILLIITGCATKPPAQIETPYKIYNGVKLYKQVPDTIRKGQTTIINNWSTHEKFVLDTISIIGE